MAALITAEYARNHLLLPQTTVSEDLDAKIEVASDIILAFIARPTDTAWTATIGAWTDVTAPTVIQDAVAKQLMNLRAHRGDEGLNAGVGICPEADALLRATGYKDPVMA